LECRNIFIKFKKKFEEEVLDLENCILVYNREKKNINLNNKNDYKIGKLKLYAIWLIYCDKFRTLLYNRKIHYFSDILDLEKACKLKEKKIFYITVKLAMKNTQIEICGFAQSIFAITVHKDISIC